MEILHDFWENFKHNLFKPLLLFFYMGFSVPILKVGFEFPYVIYQGLTIYLLVAIGWHGGEELAALSGAEFRQAGGFMIVGFVLNFIIGILAYLILRAVTKLRRVDAATVAAYYGSDSAGTFVTCVGVLTGLQTLMLMTSLETSNIKPLDLGLRNDVTLASVGALLDDQMAVDRIKSRGIDVEKVKAAKAAGDRYRYAAYMPVMLAVMEIPGCLVGLYLVSRMRHAGMDRLGNMPNEPGYDPRGSRLTCRPRPVATGRARENSTSRNPTAEKLTGTASLPASSVPLCCTKCSSIQACFCCSAGS